MNRLQNLSYKTLFTILVFSLAGIVFFIKIGNKTNKVSAAWWDDMWHYRKSISVNNTGSNQSNVYLTISTDTSDTSKFQPDCGDLRFTDQNSSLLNYYIVSGCGTTATSIHINSPTLISGNSNIFMYYGNPSATNGFSTSDFSTPASLSTPSVQSEEIGGGPIAYWKFDEGIGTTAYDSANTNNGTLSGTTLPEWQNEDQCISGKCLSFNGNNNSINTGTIPTLNTFTLNAWIKAGTDISDFRTIIDKTNTMNDRNFWLALESGTGQLSLRFSIAGVSTTYLSNTTLNDNKWHYVSATYDNSYVKLYVDGKLNMTPIAKTGIPNTANINSYIGMQTGSYRRFNGLIDEVKIYPYARTATQIKNDYNSRGSTSGGGANLGIKSNTAPPIKSSLIGYWKLDENNGVKIFNSGSLGSTLNGDFGTSNPSWTNNGKNGKALTFNNKKYAIVNNNNNLIYNQNGFTYSAWIKASSFASSYNMFMGQYLPYFDVYNNGSTNKLHMSMTAGGSQRVVNGTTTMTTNRWYHVVATYDSQGYMKVYLDGKLDGTAGPYLTPSVGNQNLYLGTWESGLSYPFNGDIDEVKVYNRALTADEIKQDYNGNSAIQFGQSTQNIGDTTTSLDYCIPGDTSYCASPVAEYNFEENTGITTKDTSGNNNNGTFGTGNSAPTWGLGANNKGAGLNFDGNDDFVSIPNYNYTANTTISVWIKGSYANGNQIIIGSPGSISLGLYNIGSTKALIGFAGTSKAVGIANNFINDSWNHLSVSIDSSGNATYYCNGQLLSNNGTNNWTWNSGTYIGRRDSGTYFKGQIDHIKIYNYARTPAQVAYDYNRGAPIGWWKLDECQGNIANDSSGLGNTGAISIGLSGSQTSLGTCQTGTSAAWTNGFSGRTNGSLNFDGTDDYLTMTNLIQGATTFSTTGWIKLNANQTGKTIFSNQTTNNNSWVVGISDSTTNTLKFYLGSAHLYATTPFQNNSWYHFVATYNNGNPKIYINGQLNNSSSDTIVTSGTYLDNAIGCLNRSAYKAQYFNGQIDDVRIYNYALTSEQIKQVYNGGAINFQ